MTQRTLQNRISQLKQLEQEKKAIEKQMEVLQAEIKQEMKNRGTDETTVGNWAIRFKAVASNKFNSKQFKADHPRLYQKYMGASETMRFTVVETA